MTDPITPKKLNNLSDIRQFFLSNTEPIYFISATNFNLLGADEWVKNFKFISHIDCFNGLHPNVFSPKVEIPHEEFSSIEDINNYLLQHPEVIDFFDRNKVNGKMGKALFLMFDAKTEELCKNLGLELCMPSAKIRHFLDNKVNTNRVAEKANVPCVPYVLSHVLSYEHLISITQSLGTDLVIQSPYGDSGHTTFFIATESDFEKYKEQIITEAEVKIMKRINCRGAAIEACVTKQGTIVAPLMTELVGFPELTPYRGGWCGNEMFPNAFTATLREKAKHFTKQFGDQLQKEGYKGYFELDFLIDQDSDEIYLGELNPRFTGASSITNHALFAYSDVPLFIFHLLEWMDVEYTLDLDSLSEKWSQADSMDSWSQLVIKHTHKTLEYVTQAPESGIWQMQKNSRIKFKKMETQRRSVLDDNEAFFLQITQEDGYLYEGADLGILIMRGRQMKENFELNLRAKNWIQAILSEFKADLIESYETEFEQLERDKFKMI